MILRLQQHSCILACIFLLVFNINHAKANPTFDCHVTILNTFFDLKPLRGEHVVNRTRETPPTTMVDSLRFNICADLKPQRDLPDQDQCPPGTRACLTEFNKKLNTEDRITGVVPIAQTSTLEPKFFTSLPPNFISVLLHGPDYPSSQSLHLTVLCSSEEKTSDPRFISYDGSRLTLEWNSPAGCPFEGQHDDTDDDKNDDKNEDGKFPNHETGSSGFGWFFPVVFLSLAAYFGLGAYYNYSTYGARGADLIPHRDFWKEVPYMLSDVVSHLCSNIRPKATSSRGGYISV